MGIQKPNKILRSGHRNKKNTGAGKRGTKQLYDTCMSMAPLSSLPRANSMFEKCNTYMHHCFFIWVQGKKHRANIPPNLSISDQKSFKFSRVLNCVHFPSLTPLASQLSMSVYYKEEKKLINNRYGRKSICGPQLEKCFTNMSLSQTLSWICILNVYELIFLKIKGF